MLRYGSVILQTNLSRKGDREVLLTTPVLNAVLLLYNVYISASPVLHACT